MKVVIVSDTHLLLQEEIPVPDGDILIHCGDCLNSGDFKELPGFLNWFFGLNFPHKILVPGNHDFCFDNEYNNLSLKEVTKFNGAGQQVHLLIDQSIEIEGVKFHGSPWQGSLPFWACYRGEKFRKLAWASIPNNLDFLITHVPPFGILDQAYLYIPGGYPDRSKKISTGNKLLREFVLEKRPKYHAFGHIHEAAGVHKENGTTFINAANLNRDYKYQNAPVCVEVETKK